MVESRPIQPTAQIPSTTATGSAVSPNVTKLLAQSVPAFKVTPQSPAPITGATVAANQPFPAPMMNQQQAPQPPIPQPLQTQAQQPMMTPMQPTVPVPSSSTAPITNIPTATQQTFPSDSTVISINPTTATTGLSFHDVPDDDEDGELNLVESPSQSIMTLTAKPQASSSSTIETATTTTTSTTTSSSSSSSSTVTTREELLLPSDSADTNIPVKVQVIHERPVLEKVEKVQQTDLYKRVHIHEKYIQDVIEVVEQPMIKRFTHPVQHVKIIDDPVYQIEGKEESERELQKLLSELRTRDAAQQVKVDTRNEVRVFDSNTQGEEDGDDEKTQTVKQVERELVKHCIITKPVITEIHEQPIEEVHEQIVQRIIYERPVLRVVRAERTLTEVIERTDQLDLSQLYPGTELVQARSSSPTATTTAPPSTSMSAYTSSSGSVQKSDVQQQTIRGVQDKSILKDISPVTAEDRHLMTGASGAKMTSNSPLSSIREEEEDNDRNTSSIEDSGAEVNLSSTFTPITPLQEEDDEEGEEDTVVWESVRETPKQRSTSDTLSPTLSTSTAQSSSSSSQNVKTASVPAEDSEKKGKSNTIPKVGFGASINEEFGQKLSSLQKKKNM